MIKTCTVDWLSFTNTTGTPKIGFIHDKAIHGNIEGPDIPRFGYNRAERLSCGVTVMFDGSTASMGQHYVYSGSALAASHQVEPDFENRVMKWHMAQGHKCTRIDLAVDVIDSPDFLPQLESMLSPKRWLGTAQSATTVKSSSDDGLTIYVGSRTSERFVRIYNKAAQMGQTGHWTRIEAEIKGDSARAIHRAILGVGDGGLSMVAQSVISRVVRFPCEAWDEVFDGTVMEIGTPKETERQTEKWIMGQVASALAKFEREHPEKRILERLWTQVTDMLGEG